jgi:hypothetical protein
MSKIECTCGATIHDITDSQPWSAHVIPDQDWNGFGDAIDEAIEKSGPSAKEKEAACMKLRYLSVARTAFQCSACGRIYIYDQNQELQQFLRASDDVPCELFRSRPSR